MKTLKGLGVSRGFVSGSAHIFCAETSEPNRVLFPRAEKDRRLIEWRNARQAAADEIDAAVSLFADKKDEREAVFLAQKEILFDEEIETIVEAAIEKLIMPDYAVSSAFNEFIALVEGTNDELIAERADDLRDVKRRLLRCLSRTENNCVSALETPCIIVARELFASDTAEFDRNTVLGIITERGGASSHTAIIARALGIPAAVGVLGATEIIGEGERVLLDGETGEIEASFDSQTLERFELKKRRFGGEQAAELSAESTEARLKDGERVLIGLNAGKLADLESPPLIDFVGLLRTEFMFMNVPQEPSEEKQYELYSSALEGVNGKPLTLRVLDIGGDKTPVYLAVKREDNPFLGKRGIRFLLDNKRLFKTQLRAALRAGRKGKLKLMLPMVSTLEDIRSARTLLNEVKDELTYEKVEFSDKVELGVMIETPSAALNAESIAGEVDFASIGTNDLTQYLFAADRLNSAVSVYQQSLSPVMLRTISGVIAAFGKAEKELSVCGELASEPMGALLLVGLGLRRLSMSAAGIGRIKLALSKFTRDEAEAAAKRALLFSTQSEVEEMLKEEFRL